MIKIETSGNFKKTSKYFNTLSNFKTMILERYLSYYGEQGVEALRAYTPKDTGLTSESWFYKIEKENDRVSLVWDNSNVVDDWCKVAVLIQYGHATGSGAYIQGVDYINPAIRPIFEDIANDIWEVVLKL